MDTGFVCAGGLRNLRRVQRQGSVNRRRWRVGGVVMQSGISFGRSGGGVRGSVVEDDLCFSSAVSTKKRLSEALRDAVDEALFSLPVGCVPDVAILYVSTIYEERKVGLRKESVEFAAQQIRELIPGVQNVIGGTVAGVLGADSMGRCTEVESIPAVGVTLARIPDAEINLFHVNESDLPNLDGPQEGWKEVVGGPDPKSLPTFFLFCNSTFQSSGALDKFIRGLDFAYPGSMKVGGVVGSSGPNPGCIYATLVKDLMSTTSKCSYKDGLVGLSISGGIEVETLVTQGVRGIGPVFTVRKVKNKSVLELDFVPSKSGAGSALQTMSADRVLKMVISEATKSDQALLFKNPLLGVALDESKERLRDGDYLVRKIEGIDPRSGGIELLDDVRVGQRVRFHVRDAKTAVAEFETILDRAKRNELQTSLEGSVMKPIVGTLAIADVTRGVKFFKERNVDTETFIRYAPTSLLGCFAQAEIAPLGGQPSPTYTHESVSAFTVIRRRSDKTVPAVESEEDAETGET